MKPLQTCPRCAQAISLDETVEFDGARVVHFDCRRPRSLSREERVLLSRYCTERGAFQKNDMIPRRAIEERT